MALIAMAVHDTEANLRSQLTMRTVESLFSTVDFRSHRLIVINNGSCEEIKKFLSQVAESYSVIHIPSNIGTARAINLALKQRKTGEYCIKCDNDVVWHNSDWVEQMQDVMERMPQLGILGLKRVDLAESPTSSNPDYRSRFVEVPHKAGQRWRVVEECKQVMGTCTMLSPALLDKIGYYYQMDGLYGFDDSLMCVRSNVAGYMNAFLHGIDIDHIDPGGTTYSEWKQKYAGGMLSKYAEAEAAYKTGVRGVWEEAV